MPFPAKNASTDDSIVSRAAWRQGLRGMHTARIIRACGRHVLPSLLSGQELNKFSWLSAMTYSEPSASWKTTDSIEAFSNTVTENTCINV